MTDAFTPIEAEEEESKPLMRVIERHEGLVYPGSISFPHVNTFNGMMRKAIVRLRDTYPDPEATKTYKPTNYDLSFVEAIRAAKFVEQYGEWAIEGLTVTAFAEWPNNPASERPQFVRWLAEQFIIYQRDNMDPNYKPGG